MGGAYKTARWLAVSKSSLMFRVAVPAAPPWPGSVEYGAFYLGKRWRRDAFLHRSDSPNFLSLMGLSVRRVD